MRCPLSLSRKSRWHEGKQGGPLERWPSFLISITPVTDTSCVYNVQSRAKHCYRHFCLEVFTVGLKDHMQNWSPRYTTQLHCFNVLFIMTSWGQDHTCITVQQQRPLLWFWRCGCDIAFREHGSAVTICRWSLSMTDRYVGEAAPLWQTTYISVRNK